MTADVEAAGARSRHAPSSQSSRSSGGAVHRAPAPVHSPAPRAPPRHSSPPPQRSAPVHTPRAQSRTERTAPRSLEQRVRAERRSERVQRGERSGYTSSYRSGAERRHPRPGTRVERQRDGRRIIYRHPPRHERGRRIIRPIRSPNYGAWGWGWSAWDYHSWYYYDHPLYWHLTPMERLYWRVHFDHGAYHPPVYYVINEKKPVEAPEWPYAVIERIEDEHRFNHPAKPDWWDKSSVWRKAGRLADQLDRSGCNDCHTIAVTGEEGGMRDIYMPVRKNIAEILDQMDKDRVLMEVE